eukprot:gnl/MRDRNA2_/MRDRNA2_94764_c0_seq1.p1 gnl/MRDRNA2_/MRDRNA2_94764_c0~~gnl/MRDRNA2_/MRDRNA2_94764_c0_seq1.p1  ORF type:complete len:480 (+),score=107.66 gnl/MRDRNA2_/MRDRNA2_94764_c0_seq1:128-1441(+)
MAAKDVSTVKIDFAAICPPDCNDDTSCGCDDDASGQSQTAVKELVTDQENVPPNGFKVPKISHPNQNDEPSTPVSTAASTIGSAKANDKEVRLSQQSLHSQDMNLPPSPQLQEICKSKEQNVPFSNKDEDKLNDVCSIKGLVPEQKDTEGLDKNAVGSAGGREDEREDKQRLLASDLNEQCIQPEALKACSHERGASAFFELKVTRNEWADSQHSLARCEVVSIASSNDLHLLVDLKIADIKTILEKHNVKLRSGEILDTANMVLTTPGKLTLGEALNDGKTLAGSGVSLKGPELLLLDVQSFNKACSTASLRQPLMEQKALEVESPVQTKAEKEQDDAEQQMKVQAWLRKSGFKNVNELVRKRLTKTRPLHFAVQKGDADMVSLLLLVGADPQLRNGKQETALTMAKRIAKNSPTATTFKVVTILHHSNVKNKVRE